MREVTKEEFFQSIGPRDVVTSIRHEKWNSETGYTTDWKTRGGHLVGTSQSGNGVGHNKKFWLA